MIKIDGKEVKIAKGSLNISDVIEERSVCTFTVIDEGVQNHYKKGQPVEIIEDGKLIFAGIIDTPTEHKAATAGDLYHNIVCADWHYLADKRIAAKAYENTTAGDIVENLITDILSEEDVTIGEVQSGPIIEEAIFNYVPVSTCLDSLAEKSGFMWYIDYDKSLYFIPRSTNTSPFAVSNEDMEKGSISVEHANPLYRNRQYIKGGRDITDPQTELKRGDGDSQSFGFGYPIARVPTIEVSRNNGPWEPQTVGIRGLNEVKQWYWSKGDNTIVQDENETVLSTDDRVRMTYQGEFDIVVITHDQNEITRRQEVEGGGSGYVEDVADEPQTTTREAAFQSANSKLQKYGVIGRKLSFRTWKTGLEVGQILTVNLPEHDLDGAEMLIDAVTITKEDNMLWYAVSAVEGPVTGSWTKMFERMAAKGQSFVIRENVNEEQVLITLAPFNKVWTEVENPNIFREVYPSNSLFPGANTFPMFDHENRVKYMSWYNGTTELGRKVLTKQVGADTDEILSTVFLAPFEANTTITHLGWWGGWQATAELGSGVLVDKQAYSKVKTELEAIQVEKTDTKGW